MFGKCLVISPFILLVVLFGPPQFMLAYLKKANEAKVCETTRTKRKCKTKRYKPTQIYISTIHAMIYFKILLVL